MLIFERTCTENYSLEGHLDWILTIAYFYVRTSVNFMIFQLAVDKHTHNDIPTPSFCSICTENEKTQKTPRPNLALKHPIERALALHYPTSNYLQAIII